MSEPDTEGLEAWLKSRPECVQMLAKEFPLGATFDVEGTIHHLIGYTENDFLILSPIDPAEDLEAAHEARIYACASHYRADA